MESNALKQLEDKFKETGINYKLNEPLAPFTTFKIGGPADILAEVNSKEEFIQIVKLATSLNIPYTIIGWGSNVLISDKGLRGLVIRNKTGKITVLGETENQSEQKQEKQTAIEQEEEQPEARLDQLEPEKYYSFADLDYDETQMPKVQVNIESGAGLPVTIMHLIRDGITGLQWFGGIPGTIGGAVYNNIHGGSHFLSEFIEEVEVFDPLTHSVKTYTNEECQFEYDHSRFHGSKDIILSAKFNLFRGDKDKAKYVFQEWTKRKAVQPQKSAGCVWQNLSEEDKEKLKLESTSWGYIIDKILGLKGKTIGGARISEKHAAFIENFDNAKAKDVLKLMELIKENSKSKLGIIPKSEIFILGEN